MPRKSRQETIFPQTTHFLRRLGNTITDPPYLDGPPPETFNKVNMADATFSAVAGIELQYLSEEARAAICHLLGLIISLLEVESTHLLSQLGQKLGRPATFADFRRKMIEEHSPHAGSFHDHHS